MTRLFAHVAACLALSSPGFAASSLYVDPAVGRDSNDGRSPGAAFRTLGRAGEIVRAERPADGTVTVFLRGGRHELAETLVLTADNSGASRRIVFHAYAGERPVISGGRRITGWTLHDPAKQIWRAPAPEFGGAPLITRQLFVNGRRAIRARSAGGLPDGELVTETSVTSEYRDDKDIVYIGHRTSMTEMLQWGHSGDIELVYQKLWTSPRAPVASIVPDGGKVRLVMKQPAFFWVNNKGMTSPRGEPVYVENAYELLDEPGEFYLDRRAGAFFYRPRAGENLATAEVIAPVLQTLVRLEGSRDRPIGEVEFVGIGFEHTTWMTPTSDGFPDAQNAVTRHRFSRERTKHLGRTWSYDTHPLFREFIEDGAVTLHRARDVRFTNCTFSRLGYIGLLLRTGCADVRIIGNRFDDISSTAIQIGDGYDRSDRETFYPSDDSAIIRRIEVANNRVTRAGAEYSSACGVAWVYPQDLTVAHNDIGHLPYSGLHGGWGWAWIGGADRAATGGLTDERRPPTKRVTISANFIFDISRRLVDSGNIYLLGDTSGDGPGNLNVVRENYLLNGFNTYGAIYPDEGSSFYRIERNVIENSTRWLNIWKESVHDIASDGNFTNAPAVTNRGAATPVTNTTAYLAYARSGDAEAIVARAGLEPDFRHLRREPLATAATLAATSDGWTQAAAMGDGSVTHSSVFVPGGESWAEFRMDGEYHQLQFRIRCGERDADAEWKTQRRDPASAKWIDLFDYRPLSGGSQSWDLTETVPEVATSTLRLVVKSAAGANFSEFEAWGAAVPPRREAIPLGLAHGGNSGWNNVARLWDHATVTGETSTEKAEGWVDFNLPATFGDFVFRFRAVGGLDRRDVPTSDWKVQRRDPANGAFEDLISWQRVTDADWQAGSARAGETATQLRLVVRSPGAGHHATASEFEITGVRR